MISSLHAESRAAAAAAPAGPSRRTRASVLRPPVDLEVVVPALDEEGRLPRTLARTVEYLAGQAYTSAVVVVDNGSVDRTPDIVRTFADAPVPVHLVGCARPGKGVAVRRGLLTGRSRWAGFMDADLATPIETLDRVVPLLQDGTAAVIGSRHALGASQLVRQGAVRRVGGGAYRAAARALVPTVADTQCGFKFFQGALVRDLAADCQVDGFSFDVEMLARLSRAGFEILEVGVDWSDVPGSTFHPLKHGVRSFADTLRIHRLLRQAAAALELDALRQPSVSLSVSTSVADALTPVERTPPAPTDRASAA